MKIIEKVIEKVIEKTIETIYQGKVENLISMKEFCSKTDTRDVGNNLIKNKLNLTFLKFIHKGKILLVSDRCIKNSISWDDLNERKLVFGNKIIEIDGIKYKIRLLTSNEWDNLIVKYTPEDRDSHWKNIWTWCQNIYSIYDLKNYYSYVLTNRVLRGGNAVSYFVSTTSSIVYASSGWRPILEVL